MSDLAAHFIQGLQALAARQARPRPFIDVGSLPWNEADFSQHFLRTATRSQRYTRREVAWLERYGVLVPGRRILDLACGGGRHSLAMARRGASVTGIDIGPAAIATARRRARRADVPVEFIHGDLRHLEYEAEFDAVTFLFGCFTEMPREQAQLCLQRISRSLRSGGQFVLDVYAPRFFAALDGVQEWWVGRDFIAGRFLQLVLTEYFYYRRDRTYARRDFICHAATGEFHTFGVSGQAYRLPELQRMLKTVGLMPIMAMGGWNGEAVRQDSDVYILLASKVDHGG